ncbi:hypothetical protein PanWU01x14_293090 [Parasponia andersonii]|uniref:Uncharacterized protein n=1 Tax=Parasponia andersonii TaxID=3476 RepID=A0A2P5AWR3_PARAD|nr:hypothetical protein PanWU01x14_293090 [Parasponia andersonii]
MTFSNSSHSISKLHRDFKHKPLTYHLYSGVSVSLSRRGIKLSMSASSIQRYWRLRSVLGSNQLGIVSKQYFLRYSSRRLGGGMRLRSTVSNTCFCLHLSVLIAKTSSFAMADRMLNSFSEILASGAVVLITMPSTLSRVRLLSSPSP